MTTFQIFITITYCLFVFGFTLELLGITECKSRLDTIGTILLSIVLCFVVTPVSIGVYLCQLFNKLKKYDLIMTPQQFIKEHKVAVDLVPYLDSNGKRNKPVCMLSISNAEQACSLAEYNLAQHLLTLHKNARIECLERIVYNFENKK